MKNNSSSKIAGDILDKTSLYIEYVGVLLMWLVGIIVFIQITVRFLPVGGTWMPLLSQILFVIMVLVGIPYAIRNEEHISIRSLFRFLPERIKNILIIISNIFVGIFCIIMVVSGYVVGLRRWESSVPTLGWIKWGYIDIIISIVFILSIIFLLEMTVKRIKGDLS